MNIQRLGYTMADAIMWPPLVNANPLGRPDASQ